MRARHQDLTYAAVHASGRSIRHLAAFTVATVLVVSCATSESSHDPMDRPAGGSLALGDEAGPEIELQPMESWGAGRAVSAQYHDESSRTLVVTTVGLGVLVDGTAKSLGDHGPPPRLAAIAPDGRSVAGLDLASEELLIVNAADGEVSERMTAGPPGAVLALAWTPEGEAVVASGPTAVTLVAIGDGSSEVLAEAGADETFGMATVAVGPVVAVPRLGEAGGVTLWRSGAGSTDLQLPLPPGSSVRAAALSPDGRFIGVVRSAADDPFANDLIVHDLTSGRVHGEVRLDQATPLETGWGFVGGDRLLAGTADGLELHSLEPSEESILVGPHGAPLVGVSAADGRVVTQHADGSLVLWSDRGEYLHELRHGGGAPGHVSMSVTGDAVSHVDTTGEVRVWSTIDGALLLAADDFTDAAVTSLAITDDGTYVATGSPHGDVRYVDTTQGDTRIFSHEGRAVDAVAFAGDDGRLVTGAGAPLGDLRFDDTLTIWDLTSGAVTATRRGDGEAVPGCAFFDNRVDVSPSGNRIAASAHDFVVRIWNVDGSLDHETAAHGSTVHDLAFTPDGRLLLTSSDDATLRVWDVEERRVERELPARHGGYWSVATLPDSERALVADITGTLMVVDLSDGSVVREFDDRKSRSSGLAVSPDGSLAAAGNDDGRIVVWSVSTGQVLARASGHDEGVFAVEFAVGGTMLYSGGQDGTIRSWAVQGIDALDAQEW